ncbi:hypothetical protein CANCADRAFT_32050 [Tortispora caseinolytica NRRL Y-17796]|uniref:Uncharacterized protein n=1 Tax=Tortispora caseinolytica NRRL Y-17796 TaxID=767744 RepID=A0A1E4TIA0_9ASCO|nr:hypothetical protein CANCADRAFT_32050 [Tortispora caseinolytica NRRL Y-17796]
MVLSTISTRTAAVSLFTIASGVYAYAAIRRTIGLQKYGVPLSVVSSHNSTVGTEFATSESIVQMLSESQKPL